MSKSAPLAVLDAGQPRFLVPGTLEAGARYEADAALEALWRQGNTTMQPFYQDNLITLYHGDCLTAMPELEAQSFDAIITDVPYGTTACAWDSPIPFAPMWACLKRLGKPRAAHVLFGSQPFTSALVMSNPEWFKYPLVWEKSNPTGFLNALVQPLRSHEDICIFCDGTPCYNPQKWKVDDRYVDRRKNHNRFVHKSKTYGLNEIRDRYVDDGSRYPMTIISIPSVSSPDVHEVQKPLALMEYLVRTYTNPGDRVLDFTSGSGTTLRACKNLGRACVGIEQELRYCEATVKRLAPAFEAALIDDGAALTDLPLFADA
jgi:site-specific DNA-methyltransferase (adenine-specific)